MWKKGVISFDWRTKEDVAETTRTVTDLIDFIWNRVQIRWPELFISNDDDRRIIQGSIGYTAITRSMVKLMRDIDVRDRESFMKAACDIIMNFKVGYEKWVSKGIYSKYSSESGYKIVSDELIGKLL